MPQAEEGADPPAWTQNAKLGRFTNFVNLLDMCGIAIPSGLVSYDAAHAPQVGKRARPGRAGCAWHEVPSEAVRL